MKIFTKSAVIIFVLVMIAACGSRGIPAIQQEALDKKISVLMLTGPNLTEQGKQAINSVLPSWRKEHLIAYEWIQGVSALDEPLRNKLKTRVYDYIYVIGNELLGEAANLAAEKKDSRWVMIEDVVNSSNAQILPQSDSILLLKTDPAMIEAQKDNWVQQLLAQNASIEWVTQSTHPIPSLWAPSEEADRVVYWDNNQQWFGQLAFQTKQHFSNWIVFYAPADEAMLTKAKTLGINVKDLSSSFTADLNWAAILDNQLSAITQGTWKSGTQSFTEQELRIKM